MAHLGAFKNMFEEIDDSSGPTVQQVTAFPCSLALRVVHRGVRNPKYVHVLFLQKERERYTIWAGGWDTCNRHT